MRDVAQNSARSKARNFAIGEPLQQLLTWRLENWVRREVINECIGINEHIGAAGNIREHHGDSWMSNSGSRAIRSIVSASPFQPIRPAVARTLLARHSA